MTLIAPYTLTDAHLRLWEAIQYGKGGAHGYLRSSPHKPRAGCNLKKIHGCYWCRAEREWKDAREENVARTFDSARQG